MNIPKCPCYQCKDRADGCHGKCEEYKRYQGENRAYKNAERKDREADYANIKAALQLNVKRRYE